MSIPYFAFYPKDWLADTGHLTYEERGVYFDLLCHMWVRADESCTLPDDDRFLASLLRLPLGKWRKLRENLIGGVAPVLSIADGRLTNKRLAQEFAIAKQKSDKAAQSARIRWQPNEPPPSGVPMQSERNANASPNGYANVLPTDMRSQCYPDKDKESEVEINSERENTNTAPAHEAALQRANADALQRDRERKAAYVDWEAEQERAAYAAEAEHERQQRAVFDAAFSDAHPDPPVGAPIDRPVRPAFKPSENPDVRAFVDTELLAVYPLRDGKFRSPEKGYAAVASVPRARWPELVTGAGYYAESIDATDSKTKDLHNWIYDGDWEEWAKGPAAPRSQKGSSSERSRYESPAERREREYRESIASIYGTPATDQGGAYQEPPALPDGTLDARVIDLDSRRLGGNAGRDPDDLAGPRVSGGAQRAAW